MKLFFAPLSPYARKVRVLAHETGLIDRIEPALVTMTPVTPSATLNTVNPLGKVPCLITDDGTALYDSRVICEYLDTLHDGPKMFPIEDPIYWQILTQQALCDGMLDAAIAARYEMSLRPEPQQWQEWIDRQLDKVWRGFDQLEATASMLDRTLDIGVIAAAVTCGYIDLRYADLGWRDARPRLTAWYEGFAEQESMIATRPE